jgi:hypothetical protein
MNRVYLFSLPELLTEENLPDIEIKGLAEWSDHVPDLFLFLIGPSPATFPWAVYDDGNHPPAFVCDWADAAARLDALITLAQDTSDLAEQLTPIRTLLHEQRNRLVVLHVSELASPQHGRKYDKKGFKGFMAELVARADALAAEFAAAEAIGSVGAAQPALARLLAQPQRELGYWDARIETGYWLDHDEPDEVPEFLREFDGYWHNHAESAADFDRKLGAYEVRRCVPGAPTLYGIVTGYGRWLLPLSEVQPFTNRYDKHATRSWIEISRQVDPASVKSEQDVRVYGLLDANGVEVLPMDYVSLHTVGDKLIYFRTLADYLAGKHCYRLMRVDTGEVLPDEFDEYLYSARDDGYIEAGLFGDAPRRGLLDRDGRRVTDFVFEGFSEFHKKHKVAIVQQGGKCGLIDQHGKVILPIVYDRIAQKLSDGPPHFHGNATLIFTAQYDNGERIHRSDCVGVADKTGRVIAPPEWEPWHLQWAFDKDGRMLVHRDDVMYNLYADGTLSEPQGSLRATLDEMSRAFAERWKMPQPDAPDAATLAAQVDRAACDELISILCRGNTEACASVQTLLAELLGSGNAQDDGDDSSIYVTADDQPATPFFRVLAFALRDEGIWMHLDWKAVDEIPHAASHLPDLAPLQSFTWDGMALGEDISDGFDALDAHLARHGYRLVNYRTDGDYYLVGAVTAEQLPRCIELAHALGVPIEAIDGDAL